MWRDRVAYSRNCDAILDDGDVIFSTLCQNHPHNFSGNRRWFVTKGNLNYNLFIVETLNRLGMCARVCSP